MTSYEISEWIAEFTLRHEHEQEAEKKSKKRGK